jgi:molybdopterin molybdotransferase
LKINLNLMLSVSEALEIVLNAAHPLEIEEVALDAARGRILAEDIIADTDLPPFDRSQMDGYAVRSIDVAQASRDAPSRLEIVGESAAGRGWGGALQANEAARIMTGAPVPRGADAVQQLELARESDDGKFVEIFEPVAPGKFIIKRASEIEKGTIALCEGESLTCAMIAVLASFGYARVRVRRRPRAAILATGNELVAVEQMPGADQIRDSNSHTIAAYAEAAGALVERLPLAGDDERSLRRAIFESAQRADMLILSGGVSVGVYDFTKAALRALNAKIFFERLSLRPGKPTVFAELITRRETKNETKPGANQEASDEQNKDEVNDEENDEVNQAHRTLVFGLPGNPVSVAVTFNLFARAALLAMQGAREKVLPEETAILADSVKGAQARASYLPATLRANAQAQLIAAPLRWGGSSDFVAFARADALLIVPAGTKMIEAGATVKVVRLPK